MVWYWCRETNPFFARWHCAGEKLFADVCHYILAASYSGAAATKICLREGKSLRRTKRCSCWLDYLPWIYRSIDRTCLLYPPPPACNFGSGWRILHYFAVKDATSRAPGGAEQRQIDLPLTGRHFSTPRLPLCRCALHAALSQWFASLITSLARDFSQVVPVWIGFSIFSRLFPTDFKTRQR